MNILNGIHERLYQHRNPHGPMTEYLQAQSTEDLLNVIPQLASTEETGERIHAARDACILIVRQRLQEEHISAQRTMLSEHVQAQERMLDKHLRQLRAMTDDQIKAVDRLNRSTTWLTVAAIAATVVVGVAGIVVPLLRSR